MSKVLTDFNLLLNWKKEKKVYKIVKNYPINLPEEVINYLKIKYPQNQIKIVDVAPIAPVPSIPINVQKEPSDMILEDLIVQSKIISSVNADPIKTTIEQALNKGIIIRKGVWYEFEGENICKGINKLKDKLENDMELLNKIHNKL